MTSSRPVRLTRVAAAVVSAGLALTTVPAVGAAEPAADRPPRVIPLPDGFQPEGITTGGGGRRAWVGSLADGDIYRIDLRTGRGRVVSQGPGTPSVGIEKTPGRLFVAGGDSGLARVVNLRTGRILRSYRLGRGTTFVNDVVVTDRAAWFTDSFRARLYKLPLGPRGALPRRGEVERLALRGQWRQPDPGGFGANGIETTPDGRALLVVDSTSGRLFRVDPRTGRATRVDLRGASLTNGDGLLRDGRTLYAVRNQLNRVAVLRLGADGRDGRQRGSITSPRFDVPTTVAKAGRRLYLPNARFSTPPTPTTSYDVVSVAAR